MRGKLRDCTTRHDRTAWAVTHLRAGGVISDLSLWLSGVDRPMRLVADAKSALRAEGLFVGKALRRARDAAGQTHDVLTWSMKVG